MTILCERGYLIVAVNTDTVDYVSCARKLAASIKTWHPDAHCCLVTDDITQLASEFDHVMPLPFGDQAKNPSWRLENDWQAGWCSPYRQTIKLEADMLCSGPIDHWWTLFQHRDLVISTGCIDFYGNVSNSRYYRKIFDNNDLPDVYSAITYWRLSATAKEFWRWVRLIFSNWTDFKTLLKFPDDYPTTDVVYAMAATIMGTENVTMPFASYPKIIHMKKHIIPIDSTEWTRELVSEIVDGRTAINTVRQTGMLHYHVKTWQPDHEQR